MLFITSAADFYCLSINGESSKKAKCHKTSQPFWLRLFPRQNLKQHLELSDWLFINLVSEKYITQSYTAVMWPSAVIFLVQWVASSYHYVAKQIYYLLSKMCSNECLNVCLL